MIRSQESATTGAIATGSSSNAPRRQEPSSPPPQVKSMASASRMTMSVSTTRSRITVPKIAAVAAPVSRERYQERTTSPMRSGKTLFAMNPTATARNSAPLGISWMGSVKWRQRSARRKTTST